MIRYTTPWQYFRFAVDPETRFAAIEITYRQDDENKLIKEKSDLTFYNAGTEDRPVYMAKFKMTQAETALFDGAMPGDTQQKSDVYIQVRALTTDGDALAGKVTRAKVWDVLNGEELEEPEEVQEDDH